MDAFQRGACFLALLLLASIATAEEQDIVVLPPEVEVGCVPPIAPNCPPPGMEPCLPPMYAPPPPHYPLCQECHWMWPNPTAWTRRVCGHSVDRPPFAPWVENPCGSTDCDFVRPGRPLVRRYMTAADAVFLFREDPDLVAFSTTFGADFTAVNGVDMGVAPRLQLIAPIDAVWDVEGNYFGLDSWHVTADYDLAGPLGGRLDFDSSLHSSEFNFRHNTRDWLKLLWGFRYIEFNEQLDFLAPSVVLPAIWHFDARNFMYGLQIGADVGMVRLWDRLEFNSVVKAGVFDNRVISREEVTTIGVFSRTDVFLNKFDEIAFVGEASLGGAFHINDHFALRGGYQMLFLQDVATAINSFTEPEGLRGMFFHGAYAGLELRY